MFVSNYQPLKYSPLTIRRPASSITFNISPLNKSEPLAEFENKLFQFPQNRGFQIGFKILIFQAENVKLICASSIYWGKLKQRLKEEGSELLTNCQQLKMEAADGKKYLTDVADTEQVLRLIQSIPSKKAEPFDTKKESGLMQYRK